MTAVNFNAFGIYWVQSVVRFFHPLMSITKQLYPMIMSPIEANLQQIRHEMAATIARLEQDCRQNVILVAISKTKSAAKVREAYLAGQLDFGENYVQEGVAKIAELAKLGISHQQGLVWHFVGPLQSNKAKLVAQYFDWAHGVDRLKIAQLLSLHRGATTELAAPLNICLQVNISGEVSKSGISRHEVPLLAAQVALLPNIKLRGLMTIIENTRNTRVQRAQFRQMRTLWVQLLHSGLVIDTLSMGMSQDFKMAIEEGATMIRIGSAIFGERN